MENMGDWEQKNLLKELAQGRELAKQLQIHLNVPSSSNETRELLAQRILTSFEKALSMLNWSSSTSMVEPHPSTTGVGIIRSESPPSLSGSPHSEDSDRDLKDPDQLRDAARKRKSLPRWTQQVRVSPGSGLEGPLDDGYSWRKYGQKDILGAKYPRGYYRCTHRSVQGCLATKQVQRSDEDPTIFEITYRGRHTCSQASHVIPPSAPPENQEPIINSIEPQKQRHQYPPQSQLPSPDLLLNFQTDLKVITQDLDATTHREQTFPSFHLPSTSNIKAENHEFSPSMIDHHNFMGHFPPSFISSTRSAGTSYFSVSPSGISSIQGNPNFQSSGHSELSEIIPGATSATNSPTVGLGFPFGNVEFDPNFTFDNPGFFS